MCGAVGIRISFLLGSADEAGPRRPDVTMVTLRASCSGSTDLAPYHHAIRLARRVGPETPLLAQSLLPLTDGLHRRHRDRPGHPAGPDVRVGRRRQASGKVARKRAVTSVVN